MRGLLHLVINDIRSLFIRNRPAAIGIVIVIILSCLSLFVFWGENIRERARQLEFDTSRRTWIYTNQQNPLNSTSDLYIISTKSDAIQSIAVHAIIDNVDYIAYSKGDNIMNVSIGESLINWRSGLTDVIVIGNVSYPNAKVGDNILLHNTEFKVVGIRDGATFNEITLKSMFQHGYTIDHYEVIWSEIPSTDFFISEYKRVASYIPGISIDSLRPKDTYIEGDYFRSQSIVLLVIGLLYFKISLLYRFFLELRVDHIIIYRACGSSSKKSIMIIMLEMIFLVTSSFMFATLLYSLTRLLIANSIALWIPSLGDLLIMWILALLLMVAPSFMYIVRIAAATPAEVKSRFGGRV